MGQEKSPKIALLKEVLFCGLVWALRGITIGESAVDYMLVPPRMKQARMLRVALSTRGLRVALSIRRLLECG